MSNAHSKTGYPLRFPALCKNVRCRDQLRKEGVGICFPKEWPGYLFQSVPERHALQ